MGDRIVALDVETATATRESMCSLGIAVFDGEDPIEQRYWLVRPPNDVYDPLMMDVHGLRPEDTMDAPMFRGVWPELKPYLDRCDYIIAHNAGFDMGVMRATLGFYGLDIPDYTYGCTYILSNRLLGKAGRGERRLNTLCARYGVPLLNHHDASEDCIACGKMAHRMVADTDGYDNLRHAFEKEGLFKSMYRNGEAGWDEACVYRDQGEVD